MVPTASMMSMAVRPQARSEPGQRGAAAGPARDDAFRGALSKAIPEGRQTAADQAHVADPDPAGDQAQVADQSPVADPAQLAVQAQLAGQGRVAVPAQVVDPAEVTVPAQVVDPAEVAVPAEVVDPAQVADLAGVALPAQVADPVQVADLAQLLMPAAGDVAAPAPAESGQSSQTAPPALTREAALAMLKQILAEHGITALPESIQVPVPQAEAHHKAVPAGVEALVAALVQVLPTAVPPGVAPVVADDNATASGSMVAALVEDPSVQLERFVRQVAAALMSEAQPAEGKVPGGQPTFQDLVTLIAGADAEQAPTQVQAPSPAPTQVQALAQAQPQTQTPAPTPTQADTQGQPQSQNHQTHQTLPGSQPQQSIQAPAAQPALTRPKTTEPTDAPTPATSPVPQLQSTSSLTAPDPADPAPSQARPPVDPEQVVRQAARFVKVALEGQRSEVRFQMHPEHLGPIAVRLILTEGQVKANMTAADPAVKAVLEANLEQLRTRLADQGIRVEQIHVTLGGGNPTGQSHQSPDDGQQQPRQPGQHRSQGQQASADTTPEQPHPRSKPIWLPGRKGSRIDSLA